MLRSFEPSNRYSCRRRQTIRAGSAANERTLALAGFLPDRERSVTVPQTREPTCKRKAVPSVPGGGLAKRAALGGSNSIAAQGPSSCPHEHSVGTRGAQGEPECVQEAGSVTCGLDLDWVPATRGISLHPPLERFLSLSSQRTLVTFSARSTSTLCPVTDAQLLDLARRASSCSVKNSPALASSASAGTEAAPVRPGSSMATTQVCACNKGKVSQTGKAAACAAPSPAKPASAAVGHAEFSKPVVSDCLGFKTLRGMQSGDVRGSTALHALGTTGPHGPSLDEGGDAVPGDLSREPTPVVASTSAGGPASRDASPESMAQLSCALPRAAQLPPLGVRADAQPPQPSVLPAVPSLKFTRAPLPRLDQLRLGCSSVGCTAHTATKPSSRPFNTAPEIPAAEPSAGCTAPALAPLPTPLPAAAGFGTEACVVEASACTAAPVEAVQAHFGGTAVCQDEIGVGNRRVAVHRDLGSPNGEDVDLQSAREGSAASGARLAGHLRGSLGGDPTENVKVACGFRRSPAPTPPPVSCLYPAANRDVRHAEGLAAAARCEVVPGPHGDRVSWGEGGSGRGLSAHQEDDAQPFEGPFDPDQVEGPWVPSWAGVLSGKAEALAAALLGTGSQGIGPRDPTLAMPGGQGPSEPDHRTRDGQGSGVPGSTRGTADPHTPPGASGRAFVPDSTGGDVALHTPPGRSERALVQTGGGEPRSHSAVPRDAQQTPVVHGSPLGDRHLPCQPAGDLGVTRTSAVPSPHTPLQSVSVHMPRRTVPPLPIAKRPPCVPRLPVGAPQRARVPPLPVTRSSPVQDAVLEPGVEACSAPRPDPAHHVSHVPAAPPSLPVHACTSAREAGLQKPGAFERPQSAAARNPQPQAGRKSPGDSAPRHGASSGAALGRGPEKSSDAWLEPWRDLIRAEAAGELFKLPLPLAPVAHNGGEFFKPSIDPR